MDSSMDRAQWEGNWKRVGDVGWLARVGMRCQNSAGHYLLDTHPVPSLTPGRSPKK